MYISLYQGSSQQAMANVAPYLVALRAGSGNYRRLLEVSWGKSWGIFMQSQGLMQDLRKHFRKFLLVQTEDKEELYFRFYDPRVLRVFLPTCSKDQLKEFFGPVEKYIMEDEDPGRALVFSLDSTGMLKKEVISLEDPSEELTSAETAKPKQPRSVVPRIEDNTIV